MLVSPAAMRAAISRIQAFRGNTCKLARSAAHTGAIHIGVTPWPRPVGGSTSRGNNEHTVDKMAPTDERR